MYYKEYENKEGQLVIFIHGGFTTNESFAQQYQLLPDKRMIFVDLPGCGKSERIVVGSTNVKRSLLFWLYTRKIGCHILWKQNEERYRHDGTTWDCVCDMQKDAWAKFSLNELGINREIRCLFMVAQKDIKEIRESMKLWKTKFPNSEFYMVKDSGHNYFTDLPEEVNAVVASFCS